MALIIWLWFKSKEDAEAHVNVIVSHLSFDVHVIFIANFIRYSDFFLFQYRKLYKQSTKYFDLDNRNINPLYDCTILAMNFSKFSKKMVIFSKKLLWFNAICHYFLKCDFCKFNHAEREFGFLLPVNLNSHWAMAIDYMLIVLQFLTATWFFLLYSHFLYHVILEWIEYYNFITVFFP